MVIEHEGAHYVCARVRAPGLNLAGNGFLRPNGTIRFGVPSTVHGTLVSGVELTFRDGQVVAARADEGDELLQAQLHTDPGARYLGELGIGTNPHIQRPTRSILFDEKIGGTFHMALGAGYPETGSKNKSSIHWDMICDLRTDSEIRVDGELFYKNGQFVFDGK